MNNLTPLIFQRNTLETSLNPPWKLLEPCLQLLWNTLETLVKHTSNILENPLECKWNFPKTSLKHAWNILYSNHPLNTSKHPWNTLRNNHKVYSKHPRNTLGASLRYNKYFVCSKSDKMTTDIFLSCTSQIKGKYR